MITCTEQRGAALVKRVNDLAGGLDETMRADFRHQAYLKAAGVALNSFCITTFETGEPDEADTETLRILEHVAEHRMRVQPSLDRAFGIEISAGFDAAEDPARQFRLGEQGYAGPGQKAPPPLTAAARLQRPTAFLYITEVPADAGPTVFKLADAPTPEQRALDRTDETLEGFGIRLDLIYRALGLGQPELAAVLRTV